MKQYLLFWCKTLVLLVLLMCIPSGCCAQNNIDDQINRILKEQKAVGAAIVVVKDSSIVFEKNYGYNPDYEHPELRQPIPEGGMFWLASVTKTIISTAIMQMVEQGLITLDDDVNNYLSFPLRNPSCPQIPITIRMLLSHRSSLTDKLGSRTFDNLMTKNKTRYAANFSKGRPGDKYVYCNLGYNILGAIIEGVRHERFDLCTERDVLKPLNIDGCFDLTRVNPQLLVRSLNYDALQNKFVSSASVYDYQKARKALEDYQLGVTTARLVPAGGMKMRASDLARFMMMLMNDGVLGGKRILHKESIAEMCKPQGRDQNYGLALTTYTSIVNSHPLIGMRGGSHGIHSIMVYEPETKWGFVIINNGYDTTARNGADLNFRLVRMLYNYFAQ